MTKRKKKVSYVLIFCMLVYILSGVNVFAADKDAIIVDIGTASGYPGETVTISVRFSNVPNVGISNCDFAISFNADALTVSDVTSGAIVPNPVKSFAYFDNEGEVALMFADPDPRKPIFIKEEGEFVAIDFKISEEAESGEYDLKVAPVNEGSFSDIDLEEFEKIYKSGKVIVLSNNTPEPSPTEEVSPTATNTAIPSPTEEVLPTATNTPVPSPTEEVLPTATNTPVPSPTEEVSPTPTSTPVPSPTEEVSPTPTSTPVPSPTEEVSPTPTSTPVPSPTEEVKPTATNTPVPSPTEEVKPTATNTPVPSPTEEVSPTPTSTPVPSPTEEVKPTATNTPIPSPTEKVSPTPTSTLVPSPTEEVKPTATNTPVPSPTEKVSPTPTSTPVPSPTEEVKPTATNTPVPSPTEKVSPTPTSTPVPSPTEEVKPTATSTPVPSPTEEVKPTATGTPVPSPSATATNAIVSPSPSTGSSNSGNNGSTGGAPVDSPSSSQTPTATATATPTSTPEPVLTPTATPTAVVQDPVEIIPAAGDISGHWAYDYIIKLLEKKIIKGYNDGTIKPDGLITRAEVAVIIVKAKGLEIPSDTKTDFVDDDSIPEWAKGYVKAAYEAGIIKGYDDKKFKAFNILTRKEMAAMTMRAFGYEESSATLNFIDNDSIPDWAKGYIAKAVELEIIKGYKDNTFKPDGFITRAESFTILAKCLEREK